MGDSISDRMRVSLKGDYALKAIFDLAQQKPGKPIRIAGIAKRQSIPRKFLESILSGLKQGGFVESRRGAEGGYLLLRSPEVITVGEVLRFVEGTHVGYQRRKIERGDPFSDLWRKVDAAVSDIVDHTTFAELTRAWQERRDKYIPSWEI
jgi:Rrf2 family transcriptional regulator, cysteine metabolism repressor